MAAAQVYVNVDGPAGHDHFLGALQERHQTMDKASEAILALRPVTFRINKS